MVHDFRGFSPWSLGSIVAGRGKAEHHDKEHVEEQSCSPMAARKQKVTQEGVGTRKLLQKHSPSDTLPLSRLHLLVAHSA